MIGSRMFRHSAVAVRNKHKEISRLPLVKCVRHSSSAFKFKDLEYHTSSVLKDKPKDVTKIVFGSQFTDHMLKIMWNRSTGWEHPVIEPYGNLSISPAAKVLHYSTTVFEGLKAFRGDDHKIRLFRPDMNIKRLLSSSKRSALPSFDGDEFFECLKKLILLESDWVPTAKSDTPCSLYIRPTFIGLDTSLGVTSPNAALLFVILSPVGPYYPTGMKPISLLADPQFVRAFPGGIGGYKMGANYASTITLQEVAAEHGCQQCLWLLGDDHKITEVGAMNLFVFWINENGEKELITAPLDGTVLPGVTRDSLLTIARGWDEFKVSERPYTMKMVTTAIKENRLLEMFGTGTACVVAPVEGVVYQKQRIEIPTMKSEDNINMRFYNMLLDIQYGRTEKKGWTYVVE